MSTDKPPSEVAREVLRQLALRRLPPTPDNFTALYHEQVGTQASTVESPLELMRALSEHLPRDNADRKRHARLLDEALTRSQEAAARQHLIDALDTITEDTPPAWNKLISSLLVQWERRQLGWTVARKRESLKTVLAASDTSTLHKRLHGLIKAWSEAAFDTETPSSERGDPAWATASVIADLDPDHLQNPPSVTHASAESGELSDQLRDLLCFALESAVPAFLAELPELVQEARELATSARRGNTPEALQTLAQQLRKFSYRLELNAGETTEIRQGLLKLLQLLLENIDEIVIDDKWLKGQIETVRDVVARPTNVRMIDDAERRLRDVIYRQSMLKHQLENSQKTLRTLLVGFIDQLADITDHTGTYHDKIAAHAQRITQARDLSELSPVLDEVMRDTRQMLEKTRRSRDDLEAARAQARQAEARITELQKELEAASHNMRHDQLTGVLNRRGLEETFQKECARAQRSESQLCVALLDIDNFKKLNDTHGHDAGDMALVHLTTLVRENLRPTDTVARLGGEEFIILYPESTLEAATAALVRLQRQLTKRLFLANDSKILITFSAGLSVWLPGEPMDAVIKRADDAMYEAKQSGKNRVVTRDSNPP